MPGHALLPALWPLRVTFADGGRMNPVDCVHMLFTMDVEPVKLDVNWTGPDDAPTSERLLRAYRDLVRAHGFPVSLFVHPEAAGLHAAHFVGELRRHNPHAHPDTIGLDLLHAVGEDVHGHDLTGVVHQLAQVCGLRARGGAEIEHSRAPLRRGGLHDGGGGGVLRLDAAVAENVQLPNVDPVGQHQAAPVGVRPGFDALGRQGRRNGLHVALEPVDPQYQGRAQVAL